MGWKPPAVQPPGGIYQRPGSWAAVPSCVVQALALGEWPAPPHLWLVTRGSQSVGAGTADICVEQAPLWGLGRTIALEHPELRCVRVDLDPVVRPDESRLLFEKLWFRDEEDQIAIRGGAEFALRLTRFFSAVREGARLAGAPPGDPLTPIHPGRTYLISGGLGRPGPIVAGWMVSRGARHHVLLGRTGASPRVEGILSGLRSAGAEVVVLMADVAEPEQVARVHERIRQSMPPLARVVHAAGVIDDSAGQARRQAVPSGDEAEGRRRLGSARSDRAPLDFSSFPPRLLSGPGSGIMPRPMRSRCPGHHRRALGLPAVAIDWGRWAEGEIPSDLERRLGRRGLRTLRVEQALAALEELPLEAPPHVAVIAADWPQVVRSGPVVGYRRLLSEFVPEMGACRPRPMARRGDDSLSREALLATSPEQRGAELEAYLRSEAGRVLRLAASEIGPDEPLNTLGFESLLAIRPRAASRRTSGSSPAREVSGGPEREPTRPAAPRGLSGSAPGTGTRRCPRHSPGRGHVGRGGGRCYARRSAAVTRPRPS